MDPTTGIEPDQPPGGVLGQQIGRGEAILVLDLPPAWTEHPRFAGRRLERSKDLPTSGCWDGILRRSDALESLDEPDLRRSIVSHRSRLSPQGRLLVVFDSASIASNLWLRLTAEIGFLVVHSGPFFAPGFAGSLLALQRDDHRIRSYREGDESAILALFQRSFHKERSVERWAWAYRENPWANLAISLAEDPEERLTTHYAGYGMPFWYHGRSFAALQIGDTMTDPEARGVGRGTRSLLARTVRHFFACYRGTEFGFYYGFNTGPIQRFCRWFIGGMEVEPVAYRWRAPDPVPSTSGYRVRRVHRVGRRYDRFFERVAPHYGYLVLRDATYLNWRYLTCPDTGYHLYAVERWGRLVGWGVFKRGDTTLVWGDALFDPKHRRAAADLLATAWESFQGTKPEGTEAWFSSRPAWWHEQLDTLGFESRPNPSKLGFMILPDGESEAPLNQLYYTMGDGDLF